MDWLTANSRTAYPFDDAVAFNDDLTQVVDAVVNIESGRAFLNALDTVGERMILVDENSDVLLDSDNGSFTATPFGVFTIYEGRDPTFGFSARLVAEGTPSITLSGLMVPFVTQVHEYSDNELRSINELKGDITLELTDDFTVQVSDDGQRVVINLKDPREREDAPVSCDGIFAINGVQATPDGTFTLIPEGGCYEIVPKPGTNQIQLINVCQKCCECREFYNMYQSLLSVDDVVGQDIDDSVELINRYHDLVRRFDRWQKVPRSTTAPPGYPDGTTPPDEDPTSFDRGFTLGTNEGNAVLAIARIHPGAYGASLAVAVTNGTEEVYDIRVEVTSNIAMRRRRKGRVQVPVSIGTGFEFDGLPGEVTIPGVIDKAPILVQGEMYEQGMVGEILELGINAVVLEPGTSTIVSGVTLRVATEILAGSNMAGGPQPTPTDGFN